MGDATSALTLQIYPDVTKLEKTIFFFNIKHFQKFVSEKITEKSMLTGLRVPSTKIPSV